MKLWRCFNPECLDGFGKPSDFAADKPICPQCQCDGRLPEYQTTITRLEAIHFMVKDKAGPIVGRGGRYRLVCLPQQKTLAANVRATGEPLAVTCPACRESDVWQKDAEENGWQGTIPKVVPMPGTE